MWRFRRKIRCRSSLQPQNISVAPLTREAGSQLKNMKGIQPIEIESILEEFAEWDGLTEKKKIERLRKILLGVMKVVVLLSKQEAGK